MTSRPDDPTSSTPGAGGLVAELRQIREQVRASCDSLGAARGADELMDLVAEVEALKTTLTALELGVVRELEATGSVRPVGWASTQDYVTHVAGGHKGTGPATVRLAAAVDQPPLEPVGRAMADGWLSEQKAHAIERTVDALPGDPDLRARAVQLLLEEAKGLDATELKKLSRGLLAVVDPDGDERRDERGLDRLERAAHLGRHLTITPDQAGGAWIKGRCSAEDAALMKSALIPLAAPRPSGGPVCDPAACSIPGCGHDGRDPRDHGVRMLDALVESCRLLQTANLLPESHGATPRLLLTMDLESLRSLTGLAESETGEQLSASAMRRLCCDAEVIPSILGADSEVLDVGRTARLVTPAIWKALVVRDRQCRAPGCTRPPLMCHAHHIQHWADGGPTSLENLILLCGHHHRMIHAGPWTIRRTGPTSFTFDAPPGVRPSSRPPPDG